VGLAEEFQTEAGAGRRRPSARRWAQRAGRFPRREAVEQDPSQHHRPRSAALPQGGWHGGKTLLYWPRASSTLPSARARSRSAPTRLRCRRFRRGTAQYECGPAHRGITAVAADRQADDAVSGRCQKPSVRKRIEEAFGSIKIVGELRRPSPKGFQR
jgi:hypothetical protein